MVFWKYSGWRRASKISLSDNPSALSSTWADSFRVLSIRTQTRSLRSVSNLSHAPRLGIKLAEYVRRPFLSISDL